MATTSPLKLVYSYLALNDFGEIAQARIIAEDILEAQRRLRELVERLLEDCEHCLNRKERKMLIKAFREEFALTGADLTFD